MDHTCNPHQHTLKSAVTMIGIGFHSGRRSTLTLKPAPENSGIRFLRSDLDADRNEIIPRWYNVSNSSLCTRVSNFHGVSVAAVEHLLAALRCCGVDNADAVLDGDEVPIMDGSAAPFVESIRRVGTECQHALRWGIHIQHPLAYREDDKFILLLPSSRPCISVEIDFPDCCIGRQAYTAELDCQIADRVAAARTFWFAEQLEELRQQRLTRGFSLRNAILVDRDGIANEEPLRFPDEFARHMLLDVIGDLGLVGAPIHGHLFAYKPGRSLIQAFIKKLFAHPSVWKYRPMAAIDQSVAEPDTLKLRIGNPTA